MSDRPRRDRVAAEIALVGVNAVAVVGLDRLFVTTAPLRTTVPVLLVTHLILAFARRRQISAAVATLASAVTTVLIITWTLYAGTRVFLLFPSASSAESAATDLDDAWLLFQDAVAPVDPLNGYVIAAAIGTWLIAVLSDWEAFRSKSPIEAMIPALALIGYNGILGPRTGDIAAVLHGAAFCIAAGLFVILERMDRAAADTTWLAGQRARGARHTITTGLLALLPVVLVGALATPRLPGATAAPVIDVRGGGNGATPRNAISPLVDIQARLVNQSDEELFRVTSDTPSYWRLMALDLFENDRWRLERGFDEVAGELPRSEDSVDTTTAASSQTFRVASLADDWVPAAFDPIAADSRLDLLFDPVSSTLLLADEQDELAGNSYGITSRIPQLDQATADAASRQPVPADITARFTQLPSDFSPEVARIAREVTDGADTPYQEALALQNWFRTFTYDVDVSAGHSFNRIEDFLTLQRGYCEQFATSFGAMARSLGIPARVAVGFTTGDPTGTPGEYIVRGRHAHAWPEVYLAGVGWTHFEPTPGRGNPASTALNTVEAAQDVSPGADEATTTPTTVPTTAPSSDETAPPAAPPADQPAADVAATTESGGGWLTTVLLIVGGLATIVVLYVASLWWIRRHAHQRLLTADPPVRVAKAWQRADRDLRLAGVPSRPTETHLEFSDRVHATLGDAGSELNRLATLNVEATYAPPGRVDGDRAAEAETASAGLRTALHRRFPRRLRLRTWVDPRLPGPPPSSR